MLLDDNITFDDVKPYLPLLPYERQEKVARYRFDDDKLTSAVAGLLIRHMIGQRELVYGEYNKPYVKGRSDLWFSVSHSDRCVAIAVDRREVGLDVEILRTKDIEKLCDRFFSAGEREYVLNSKDKPSAFTEIWTRKEAYLKRTGAGITEDITAFDTTSKELAGYIRTIPLDGYFLSVCSADPVDITNIHISNLELKDIL